MEEVFQRLCLGHRIVLSILKINHDFRDRHDQRSDFGFVPPAAARSEKFVAPAHLG
jgi:hypothetical protein